MVGGSVLQIAVTCGLLYYFLNQNYQILVKYAGLDQEITTLLTGELKLLITAIGLIFTLFLVGNVLLGIIFSHRVAGPIYAIKRTIRDVRLGKQVRLKFREGDEFTELADNFNDLVNYLKHDAGKSNRAAGTN